MDAGRWLRWEAMDRWNGVGPLVLRLFTAFTLIYGTQDNVLSAERMHEFQQFLAAQGTPLPALAAPLSVWAQSLCGLLILAGAATRWAGAVMAVNFVAALVIAHRGLPWSQNIAPAAMLALSLYFLFAGAGPWSVDGRRAPAPP